jgi:hypothetical protein
MMQLKKVLLGLCLMVILLIQILPVGWADPRHLIFEKEISGTKKSYTAYFPAGSPYTSNLLNIRPYPIRVWYEASINDEPNGYSQRNWPYISIKTINQSRVVGSELLSVGRDEHQKGFFDLPADRGMFLDMYTGRYANVFDDGGHHCSCKLEYQLDTTPPNAPMGLTMQNLEDGETIVDGSGIHTRKSPIGLTWDIPNDHGTEFSGFTSGPSEINGYQLLNNGTAYPNNTWFTSNQVSLTLPEGKYQFQVKARDFDNNQSAKGDELILYVDRSVNQVVLLSQPVVLNGNKAVLYWNPLPDLSGIDQYEVALTETTTEPVVGVIFSENSNVVSHQFSGDLDGTKEYYAWIRAKDKLGNLGAWKRTGPFGLTPEPGQLTTAEPTAVKNGNGEAEYHVNLTVSDVNAFKYVIYRKVEGSTASRVQVAELTHDEIAASNYQYNDGDNLAKHGQYRYDLATQNAAQKSAGESSLTVTIPNLAAEFAISGPEDQEYSTTRSQTFDITPKQDLEGDGVKFRVAYKRSTDTNPYYSSESLGESSFTYIFPDGVWELWVDTEEYDGAVKIPGTYQSSAHRSLEIQGTAPLPIALPGVFKATVGNPVTFETVALQLSGQPVSYSWDPGDGSDSVSGAAPEYTYTQTGNYTVTLTVVDSLDNTYQASTAVVADNTTQGTLAVNETWSGTHRIYGDVIVPVGVTLTIQAGTEVIVDGLPGQSADHALIVQGTLTVSGGATGAVFRPASGIAGSWKGIRVEGTATLSQATVLKAKRGLAVLTGASVSVSNSTFQENLVGLHACGGEPQVSNSSFCNNSSYGIKEDDGGHPVVTGCLFSGNGMDYYHQTLTELTMVELNNQEGNSGNHQ